MKKETKIALDLAIALICVTVLFITAVCVMDVRPIGPEKTSVGLSHLNEYFFNLTGVNLGWYEITDWLGISAIVVCMIFAITGLVQLIKRKSLFKVDREILSLGVLYIIVICLYIFFETVPVNYRPILVPGCTAPEPSFPSSHTMLVCVVMGSALMVFDKYIRNDNLRKTLFVILTAIILVTVVGRLISGVHWLTDIIGGVLISASLLSFFHLVVIRTCSSKARLYWTKA